MRYLVFIYNSFAQELVKVVQHLMMGDTYDYFYTYTISGLALTQLREGRFLMRTRRARFRILSRRQEQEAASCFAR